MQASTNENIIIKDSCTIIDHCELGLLDVFFRMDLTVYSTPNVIAEITDPEQAGMIEKYIQSGHLRIDGNGDVIAINQLVIEYPALSAADSSVLELAIRIRATILTSDGSLRKASQANDVTVRGIIWVIEEMYIKGFIDKDTALLKLEQYPAINSRAPKKEILALIEKIKQK